MDQSIYTANVGKSTEIRNAAYNALDMLACFKLLIFFLTRLDGLFLQNLTARSDDAAAGFIYFQRLNGYLFPTNSSRFST